MTAEPTLTILRAAANIMRDDALERARTASTPAERACVTHALLGSICIERYLEAVEDVERPF